MVCDDTTKVCIPGCRGQGGNRCPAGKECTSADSTIGQCVPTGTGGAGGGGGAGGEASVPNPLTDIYARGGCGCVLGGRHEQRAAAPWVLAAGLLGLWRRSRRRRLQA